jgi:hypothetical protein
MSRSSRTMASHPLHPIARQQATSRPVLNLTNAKSHKSVQSFPFRTNTLQVVIRANPFLSKLSANGRIPLPSAASSLYFVNLIASLFHLNGKKRDPLFSIAYTLFAIRNFAHLFCFLIAAHSLAKTPGGGGSAGTHTGHGKVNLPPAMRISGTARGSPSDCGWESVRDYRSRRAWATGRRAARMAGNTPPRMPMTRAKTTPISSRLKVILKAKAKFEKV